MAVGLLSACHREPSSLNCRVWHEVVSQVDPHSYKQNNQQWQCLIGLGSQKNRLQMVELTRFERPHQLPPLLIAFWTDVILSFSTLRAPQGVFRLNSNSGFH